MALKDKSIDPSGSRFASTAIFVTLVALSGGFAGGDATALGQAIPVIGTGLLLIIFPLRALPNLAGLTGISGLTAAGILGLLPAAWFGEPQWHSTIRQIIPGLSNSVSLQPWLTLTRWCEMQSAVLFAAWVVQWRPGCWILCLRVLTGAIAVLGGLTLAVYYLKIPVPGWHPSQGFGPFANRNQTGTLMALGAILSAGLGTHSLRARRTEGLFWLGAFGVCVVTLLHSNSRGPVCLLALGIIGGVLVRQKLSAKSLTIAASLFLFVCSAGLLVRSEVLERVAGFFSEGAGLRIQIYQDTVQLLKTIPFTGVGLGNFEVIFPWFRQASLNGQRIIHPESDWLWAASEMGALSLVFLAVALVFCFKWPTRAANSSEQDLQLACRIAIILFFVNSLFDVPGHRFGTVLPLILVAGICCDSKLVGRDAALLPWLSRFLGIGLVSFGLFVFESDALPSHLRRALAQRDWPQVDKLASESLARTPLNWSLYISRGYAEVHQKKLIQATADFRYALALEPKLATVPYTIGSAWIGTNISSAISAWRECLKRSRGDERSELYRQILNSSSGDPGLLEAAIRLSDSDLRLCLVVLRNGHRDPKALQFLEMEVSKLDTEQLRSVRKAEARQAANEANYMKAYELGRLAIRSIAFPSRQRRSEEECRRALIENPEDVGAAYDLGSILESERRWTELVGVLEDFCGTRDCPDYLKLMKADSLASLTNWRAAWEVVGGLM